MAEGSNSFHIPVILSNTNVVSTEYANVWDNFGKEMQRMQQEMNRFQEEFVHTPNLQTPLIQNGSNGQKQLRLRFDVSQFSPNEVDVRTEDHYLLVNARHQESDGIKRLYREYSQHFLLPQGVSPDTIRCTLSADGVLTVEAPVHQALEPQKPLSAIKR